MSGNQGCTCFHIGEAEEKFCGRCGAEMNCERVRLSLLAECAFRFFEEYAAGESSDPLWHFRAGPVSKERNN